MLNFGLLTLILFLSISLSEEYNCNETIFGGPADKGVPCVFPFAFYGKIYDRCTTAYEVNEIPWCATQVSKTTRELLDENKDWGYCDPRCPFLDFYGEIFENGTTIAPSTPAPILPTTVGTSTKSSYISQTTPQPPSNVLLRTLSTTRDKTLLKSKLSHESGEWIPSLSKDECGQSISLGFVFGGEDANIGEFPFAVLLGYKSVSSSREYDYICGGVLINRRYVLTAAHCHSVDKPISVVVLGEFDTSMDPDCMAGCRPVQRFSGNLEVIKHPLFHLERNVAHNDIALIRLPRLARTVDEDLQTFVSPICLPMSSVNKTYLEAKELTVVGWGKTTYQKNDFISKGIGTEILQKLKLKIVPNHICSTQFTKITQHHICAGGIYDEDSCNGDSGSPLISRQSPDSPMVLEGIVSFGTDVCGIGAPGVYTKVDDYIEWIKSNLRP